MNGHDSASFFTEVPLAPGDPIFAVAGAYKKSTNADKVNVSIGTLLARMQATCLRN